MVLRCCGAAVLLLRLEAGGEREKVGGWREEPEVEVKAEAKAKVKAKAKAKAKAERLEVRGSSKGKSIICGQIRKL